MAKRPATRTGRRRYRHYRRRAAAEQRCVYQEGNPSAAAAPRPEHRFGPPSTFGLATAELGVHVRQLRRGGWQRWELTTRFGRWAA